ncbi:hypothetical protein F5876DRAFT_68286 [Lentinula aff. lateritia]|uniref:Uncharacterized protein n=1 Tax=Lentinula aff. lateritia TaxID=2804960 RepID=A0ACC1TR81_9AGAR|nr:hypothetical protein F5876DRAFT_68286 [Lentinula aff. lateritia]
MGLNQSRIFNYNHIERDSVPESQMNSIDYHHRAVGPSRTPRISTPFVVLYYIHTYHFVERSEKQGEGSRSDKRKTREAGPGAAHSDKDLTKGLGYSSDGKIDKPTGGVGGPGRGGYNLLRGALKWPEKRFNEVKKFIDETVEAKLDCLQPLGKQQYLQVEEVRTLRKVMPVLWRSSAFSMNTVAIGWSTTSSGVV